ncbi:hypothetical protein [Paenibacillus polymyxa]|uniref:hypothetical protein n=1 Tax=Paenibacillus TaxID=44249 RepID=UPI0020256F5B|nr:hypothetical protein [Paenibacillus polymyxa]URJ42174.1 hypothetical protein MF627_001828 [Paenibacillus polymyxa]
MIRIHSFSGGVGSMTAAARDAEANGIDGMILLFTDTLIEDRDLYRFMIESAAFIYDLPKPVDLIDKCDSIPDVGDVPIDHRREYLLDLAGEAMKRIPALHWIQDGRDPWKVFYDRKWIGNSRVAQCSEELKQKLSRNWVKARYEPHEALIYVGIDWTESHRVPAIERGWSPYRVIAPMKSSPTCTKQIC